MINKCIKYSYNDISIVPAITSSIIHRDECDVLINDKLPLFTAPMSSVVDENNFELFEEYGINAILPRTTDIEIRRDFSLNGKWSAYSLTEFEELFCDENKTYASDFKIKALIDIANGHMERLYQLVVCSKHIHGKSLEVMVGNIANPETYVTCCDSGVDYVRVGIGGGSGCITSSNTSIHMPMVSLLNEIVEIKNRLIDGDYICEDIAPKIICDGGIRNYSDIIKALALGADYVMIGGVFSKMLESAADTYEVSFKENDIDFNKRVNQYEYIHRLNLKKLKKIFFGMSTKKAQKLCGKTELKTSEGIEKIINVEYTMGGWVSNFKDYLKSAMSYTDSRNLEDFKESEIILISNNSFNSINK